MTEHIRADETKTVLLRGGPYDGWVYNRLTESRPKPVGVNYVSEFRYEATDEIVDGRQVFVYVEEAD